MNNISVCPIHNNEAAMTRLGCTLCVAESSVSSESLTINTKPLETLVVTRELFQTLSIEEKFLYLYDKVNSVGTRSLSKEEASVIDLLTKIGPKPENPLSNVTMSPCPEHGTTQLVPGFGCYICHVQNIAKKHLPDKSS